MTSEKERLIAYLKEVLDSTYSKINNLHSVAFNGNYNSLNNKPSIPSASNTTPSADTLNGDVGNGVTWARSNHKHPKSDLYAEASHSHSASDVIDSNSSNYTNIGSLSSNSSQQIINNAINSKLGALNIDVIEWDTADNNGYPSTTASANTLNKLYLIKKNTGSDDDYDVFVTKRTGTSSDYSYNWELIDSVSLDISGKADISSLSNVAFSGDYDDLTDKPTIPVDVSDLTDTQNTTFTPKTHTHNISDMSDMETVPIVVTYTDTTTETLELVVYNSHKVKLTFTNVPEQELILNLIDENGHNILEDYDILNYTLLNGFELPLETYKEYKMQTGKYMQETKWLYFYNLPNMSRGGEIVVDYSTLPQVPQSNEE